MQIEDVIAEQKKTGDVFLLRNGSFYNGYDEGAFFLGHFRKYLVRKKQLRDGTPYYKAGFPQKVLKALLEQVQKDGGKIVENAPDGSVIRLRDVDTSFDESLVKIDDPDMLLQPKKLQRRLKAVKSDIEQVILDYDIANKTPMEAMTFLNNLRNWIRDHRDRQQSGDPLQGIEHHQPQDDSADTPSDGHADDSAAREALPFADTGAVGPNAEGKTEA